MAVLNTGADPAEPGGPADLAVVGGRLVTPSGVEAGTVVLRGGRIAEIRGPGEPVPDLPRLDASGRYVLPGLIDSHVHFRTPGLEYKEDWAHASRAALAGGVTTVLDMPNTVPPGLTPERIREKAAMIEGTAWVDFRFHIGADPDNPAILAGLDPRVATSAKVFMAGHHTAPTVVRTPEQLDALFANAARGGVRLVLHAESQDVFDLLDSHRGDPDRYEQYEPSRPRSGAIVAVAEVVRLSRKYRTDAHVLHASTAEEVDLLTAAAAQGVPVTFEVTGHHLSFTDADTCRRGPRTRLSPAIRGERDQARLWAAVFAGEAASVGSDHAPHTVEEKNRDPRHAPPGLPGVQELATALWTGLRARLPEQAGDEAARHLARLMGSGPADLFGLPGKGRLVTGADADLAIFDPAARWTMSGRHVEAKAGWSAYEGWAFTGRVDATVKGGRVLYRSESGFDLAGVPSGRWLPSAERAGNRAPALAGAPA
jgi:dihydroorotase